MDIASDEGHTVRIFGFALTLLACSPCSSDYFHGQRYPLSQLHIPYTLFLHKFEVMTVRFGNNRLGFYGECLLLIPPRQSDSYPIV